ncbi:MAG: GAF domain-containing protein [Chloroflexi bacterium]|nr:GAF domain-containing protein [Chloroflexota bacterium]
MQQTMPTQLTQWLNANRTVLLPRWIAAGDEVFTARNGAGPGGEQGAEVIVHPDERRVLLTSIYDGLIAASEGDGAPLDECLSMLRALRSSAGDDDLPHYLALLYRLRRLAVDALSEDGATSNGHAPEADSRRVLVGALDELMEHVIVTSAERWVAAAHKVAHELNETRLLVESLYRDAEVTDRTTLHVSRLNLLARELSATFDRERHLARVGAALSEALAAVIVDIWLIDSTTGQLNLALRLGAEPAVQQIVPSACPDDLVVRALRQAEPMLELDLADDRQSGWSLPGSAALAVPLVTQAGNAGVIVCQGSGTMLSDRSEQEFVRSVAGQAAIALENARLYAEVREFNAMLEERIAERTRELQIERDTLETLNAIALEVSSTLDEDVIMQNSLSTLAQLIGVEHGSIMLIDRETDQLVDRAMLGSHHDVGFVRFPVGHGVVGWVAQHRKPLNVPDVAADPRWVPPPLDDPSSKRHGSMIAVPLIAHHEVQGVLVLSHEATGYFRDEHMRLLNASASQIAIGIHNAQIYREVEQQLMHRYEMQQRQEAAVSQSTAILQSLSDGVIVCDQFGSVLTANLAVERILDRPIEELVIWHLGELLKRLLGQRAGELALDDLLANPWDERNQPRTLSTTFEYSTRTISITLDPVISSKDTLMGAVAVFRDRTREIESDRLKTEFIGTVSHELRTPMTSIKGFTQLLAMGSLGPVNETQKEFLEIIQTNAERMIAIINDLLDITKIETGSVELELRPLHVAETLSGVMLELQPKVIERQQALSLSIPAGLPLVRADARRFNQILFNLVSNAVKYTPRSGKIAIEAREVGADAVPETLRDGLRPGRYVQIEVRDTGVGIAPEEIERIFERFYRTENPLKVEAGGTGLGLSLVRPLIKLLGGRIWVESQINEGSTFSFVLPAV